MTLFVGLCCPEATGRCGFGSFFVARESAACMEKVSKQLGSAGVALAIGGYCRVLFSSLLMADLLLSRSVVEDASSGGMCRTLSGAGGSTPGQRTASFGAFVWAQGVTTHGLQHYEYLIRRTGTLTFTFLLIVLWLTHTDLPIPFTLCPILVIALYPSYYMRSTLCPVTILAMPFALARHVYNLMYL